MLTSPPGLKQRERHSKQLDEAGRIFGSLYKRSKSIIDIDVVQKQAEDFLLKSFESNIKAKNKAEELKKKVEVDPLNDKIETSPSIKKSPTVMRQGLDECVVENSVVDCVKLEAVPYTTSDTCVNIDLPDDNKSINFVLDHDSHLLNGKLSRKSTSFPRDGSAFYKATIFCIAVQLFATLLLIAIFYFIVHYDGYKNFKSITTLFPFSIFVLLYGCIFSLYSNKLRGNFLVYSSDISVNVLRKRVVRQESYSYLYKLKVIGERFLVLVCVLISCLPCNFELEFSSYTFYEYSYLISIVNLFVFHYIYTYMYFCIFFNKAIKRSLKYV